MTPTQIRKIGAVLLLFLAVWLSIRYFLPILLPFLLAYLLALAADPLVGVLHRRLHLSRSVAAGIGVSIALLVSLLAVVALCALLLRQLGTLSGVLPQLSQTAREGLHALEQLLLELAAKTPEPVSSVLERQVSGFFSDGSQILDRISAWVLSLASGLLTRIPDSALGFGTWIIASFMLCNKLPQLRQLVSKQLPKSWQQQYLPAVGRLKQNLSGWLFAQIKLCGITFLILSVGLLLLRIPYAPLWAALISLVDALPVLGTGTVLLPWSLLCLLQGDTLRALGLLVTYAAVALLRSVLEPKLIGRQLGLDPLVTLLCMYAGYQLWGILGMLLSPLLAVSATQLAALARQKQ